MLNTIKGLLEGTKKVKTVEASQKELDKLIAAEIELQSKRSSVASNVSEVEQALRVISANLVIDENDKQALTQKEKGTKKLESLRAEINELDAKIVDTQQKKLEANKELYRSRGEEARKNNIEIAKQTKVIYQLNAFFGVDSHSVHSLKGIIGKAIGLSDAYGLGDFQQVNQIDQDFVIKANKEDMAKANEEASEVVKEAIQAMKAVLDKNNIELTSETAKRIEKL